MINNKKVNVSGEFLGKEIKGLDVGNQNKTGAGRSNR